MEVEASMSEGRACLPDGWLTSAGGAVTLVHDGPALVLFRTVERTPLWRSPSSPGEPSRADGRSERRGEVLLLPDGRLHLLDPDGRVLWSTDTGGSGAVELEVRDDGDGDLVLTNAANEVVWSAAAQVGAGHQADAPPPPPSMAPFVRTDRSDDAAWTRVRDLATAEYPWDDDDDDDEKATAELTPVDHPRYEGLGPDQLVELVSPDAGWPVLFVADAVTMSSPEHHVLVVAAWGDERGDWFRATPRELFGIEANLSLGNMDWADFAGSD